MSCCSIPTSCRSCRRCADSAEGRNRRRRRRMRADAAPEPRRHGLLRERLARYKADSRLRAAAEFRANRPQIHKTAAP